MEETAPQKPNMPLYQITDQLLDLSEREDLSPEELEKALNEVGGDFLAKAESIAKFIRNLEGLALACEEEESRLRQRKKTARNQARWLKGYLQQSLQATGARRLMAGPFQLSVSRNPPKVQIDDETELPPEYVKEITEYRPDKEKLKQALRSGQEIPGARLEQSEGLRIR